MSRRIALITGIDGQVGSYLTELLLEKDYEIHGLVPAETLRSQAHRLENISHLLDQITLHGASLDQYSNLAKIVRAVQPAECYHLAERCSWESEAALLAANIADIQCLLQVLWETSPNCRFCNQASSQMLGSGSTAQNETAICRPESPMGIAKLTGFQLARYYRDTYGFYATSGILFPHDSPRQEPWALSRQISTGVAQIKLGLAKSISFEHLLTKYDWGHASDSAEALWRILQQEEPDDFVVATGQTHSVREFTEIAFASVGLKYWDYVQVQANSSRTEARQLGDARRARSELGWVPQIPFEEMVYQMVSAEVQRQMGVPSHRLEKSAPVRPVPKEASVREPTLRLLKRA